MRVATLGLALVAACHGGFFTGSAAGNLPSDSDAGDLGWETTLSAGGYLSPRDKRTRVGLEAFGGYADNDLDHVFFGGGARVEFAHRDSGFWRFRGGGTYHNLQGIRAEGPGLYLGISRPFWLDKNHRWSLGPEVRVDVWENIEDEVFLIIPILADISTVVNVSVGLQLTYHFGSKKSAKDEPEPHPDDRYYR